MDIVVIGSLNMDMVVRSGRAPEAGETVIGDSFVLSAGGKGANQAVAAARLGSTVRLVGKVGADAFGSELLEIIKQEGIDSEYLSVSGSRSTGVASIVLEESGENRIIVVPGANMELTADDIQLLEPVITGAKLLVMQLEMDLHMTEQAVGIAHASGIPVILNPAPAQRLSDELLSHVTYLTPNETEAGILSGVQVDNLDSAREAAAVLLRKGVQNVIMTLGAQGALIVNSQGQIHVPGFPVKAVVDTVAAGDSFNGALAQQLTAGRSLEEAVTFANAVGALAVGKAGAIPSLPTLAEVEQFLERADSVR
ncbi:ribokinase [Paenibacillus donghaensis]|uniref:Ribokinase n=1 Tax=Paenibacillus donghaensis TaxID=414771 RepID=A0A2Z2KHY9_9BACL|nr:ribokinase [Paenibacillus donghaensis]ASA25884.1 ribokinase [Paenibacillus donghaensis]